MVSEEYGPKTRHSLSQLNEKEVPFDLIVSLLQYIMALETPGAVLIFLDGWNIIYKLLKYLEAHPEFGRCQKYHLPTRAL